MSDSKASALLFPLCHPAAPHNLTTQLSSLKTGTFSQRQKLLSKTHRMSAVSQSSQEEHRLWTLSLITRPHWASSSLTTRPWKVPINTYCPAIVHVECEWWTVPECTAWHTVHLPYSSDGRVPLPASHHHVSSVGSGSSIYFVCSSSISNSAWHRDEWTHQQRTSLGVECIGFVI